MMKGQFIALLVLAAFAVVHSSEVPVTMVEASVADTDAPTVSVEGSSGSTEASGSGSDAAGSGSEEDPNADPRIPYKSGTYEFWKYKVENKVVGDPNSTVTITTEGCKCECFVVDPKASDAFDCSCKCPQTEQGDRGDRGDRGQKGYRGAQGPRGRRGYTGDKGFRGDRGQKGYRGDQGNQGIVGPAGDDGKDGTNIQGPRGQKGDTGKPPRGLPGDRGEDGPRGPVGDVGDAGRPVSGPQGPRGDAGPRGVTGPRGTSGPKGPSGDPGPRGGLGPRGLVRQTGHSAEQRRVAVQAACTAMAPPGVAVTAVTRVCGSGAGRPPCSQVCKMLNDKKQDFAWRGEDAIDWLKKFGDKDWECINSLHYYGNNNLNNNGGVHSHKMYKYQSCGGGCGPNTCCCIKKP
eukprot:TRINITY_DN2153_c0_g1_i2.p1 TRINITY_DN2153_c0_g1~~TRINITY_DN2153_c0_g1_i2.p1  ORF type:complete len:403 (-),score=97.72 TRINITY_DN2153_c0_g1_i2:249-1457(-)